MINGGRITQVWGLWGPAEVRGGSPGARRADHPHQLLRVHRGCAQPRLHYLRQTLPIQNGILQSYSYSRFLYPVEFQSFASILEFDFLVFLWGLDLQCNLNFVVIQRSCDSQCNQGSVWSLGKDRQKKGIDFF